VGTTVLTKALLAGFAEMIVFGAVLFLSAGTANWPGAWVFIAIMLVCIVVITRMLAKNDPDLLRERLALPVQRGQKGWDKVVMAVFTVIFIAWLPLMAFDAMRYQWSHVPVWLQCFGAVGLIVSFYFCYLVFKENSYLVMVVRIQKERGQHVVSTGPYHVVRHPLYASVMIFFPAIALLLGSWYGLAWGGLMMALLVVRTQLEDATLMKELEGYPDYAARVRYRLIPAVW
jgi:protein-S-isoprenylcysteine O-methyltransferase Ste14